MRNRTGLQHLFRIRLRFSSFLDATTNKQVLTTHLSTSTTHYNIANILLPVWLDWNPVSRMGFHGTPTQGFGKAYSFPPMSASRPVENSLQPHFWQEGFWQEGFRGHVSNSICGRFSSEVSRLSLTNAVGCRSSAPKHSTHATI